MTRAVFFDVDFTLIHPGPTFQGHGYAEACARHGVVADASRFDAAVSAASATLHAEGGPYDPEVFIDYTRRIIEGMGGSGPGATAAARDLYVAWSACHHFTMYEEVPEVLRALHADGLIIGLISNTQRSLKTFEEHFELHGLFKVAISSSDHGFMKPHPSIFEGLRRASVEARRRRWWATACHTTSRAIRLGMPGIRRESKHRSALRRTFPFIQTARAREPAVIIRAVTTIEECRQVATLEMNVWKSGQGRRRPARADRGGEADGILLGAFDQTRVMKGFVYSTPRSRMGGTRSVAHAGCDTRARNTGLDLRLKLAQRIARSRWASTSSSGPTIRCSAQCAPEPPNSGWSSKSGEHLRRVEQPAAQRFTDRPCRRVAPQRTACRPPRRGRGRLVRDASVATAPLVNPSRQADDAGARTDRSDGASIYRRDSRRRRRDAAGGSGAGAGVASRDPRDFPALLALRAWTSSSRRRQGGAIIYWRDRSCQ